MTLNIDAQLFNADQPFGHFNLGVFYADLKRSAKAEAAYRAALRLDPGSVMTHVNLADLYRVLDRDDDGEKLLREGLARVPTSGELHHVLGLLLWRKRELVKDRSALRSLGGESLSHLEKAADLRPQNLRFGYVFAVALQGAGQLDRAIHVANKLRLLAPRDPGIRRLIAELRAQAKQKKTP